MLGVSIQFWAGVYFVWPFGAQLLGCCPAGALGYCESKDFKEDRRNLAPPAEVDFRRAKQWGLHMVSYWARPFQILPFNLRK